MNDQRFLIDESCSPAFADHVRFRYNEPRRQWVVLAPERLLAPDDTAVEILKMVDGAVSVGGMIDALAGRYKAPRERISRDVCALLQDLADKQFIIDARRARRDGEHAAASDDGGPS